MRRTGARTAGLDEEYQLHDKCDENAVEHYLGGCVQSISKEIRELAGMVEAMRAISMQSHLLAINGAVEASSCGQLRSRFSRLAEEMRKLASNTREVGISIKDGLGRARDVVESGMAASIV